MPRIPYQPADLGEPAELVAAIRARRGGRLLNLDRMLLHSPQLAAGWNAYLRAVRDDLSLDPQSREIAMCAVAALNGADYEFHHHAPEFVRAGGTAGQVEALRNPLLAADSAQFDERQRAVLRFTVEMTRDIAVRDPTFDEVRRHFDERATVELAGVIAAYNMVSRFLVALRIEPE